MKKSVLITLAVTLTLIGFLSWWFSDAQVIQRQTMALAKSLSVASTDGKSTRLGKTRDFSSLLSKSIFCSVDTKDYDNEFGRDDLETAHHMLVQNCRSSTVKTSNIDIIERTSDQATVHADLELAVTEQGGNQHAESCKSVLTWKKNDKGKWKIESITIQSR